MIKVFVHLAKDKDASQWREAYLSGSLVGMNDITPYGYGRAADLDCEVIFSQAGRSGLASEFLRKSLRIIFGFDILHAFHNRRRMAACDVIWTHTESQWLAVAAVYVLGRARPKIIGQSVWLFDKWHRLLPPYRWLYTSLSRRVDVLTTLSPKNAEMASAIFPAAQVRFVPFGIVLEHLAPPKLGSASRGEILAVGNDRDRDWETLAKAASLTDAARVLILSGTASQRIQKYNPKCEIRRAVANEELQLAYSRANVVVVPVSPNLHASGITAVLEGIISGCPVIATRTGGLDAYFDDNEIFYVPPHDVQAMANAIAEVLAQPLKAQERTRLAQKRIIDCGFGVQDYIFRHVMISRQLMSADAM